MEARTKLGIIKAIIWRDQAEQFGFISGENMLKMILAIIDAKPEPFRAARFIEEDEEEYRECLKQEK